MILPVFIPCYFGSELTAVSEKLSLSLFHSNWVEESREFKTAMKIFMENTKNPIQIYSFGTFKLCLENFLTIINSAYSYYTVLKTINN